MKTYKRELAEPVLMDRPPDAGPEGLAENMARGVALQ